MFWGYEIASPSFVRLAMTVYIRGIVFALLRRARNYGVLY